MLYRETVRDARFHAFLLKVDREEEAATRAKGCEQCGSALHSGDFPRKPRGGPAVSGPEDSVRFSLCCAKRSCRKRHTPVSLRFLGRKVYLGAVVVIVSAMRHGVSSERMRKLAELFGVSRRTVERWRVWWREGFATSDFWRRAAASFMPPVCSSELPGSLLERFNADEEQRLLATLRFLRPITGGAGIGRAP